MIGDGRHGGQGAQAKPARSDLDRAVSGFQRGDIHHPVGTQHVQFHQVDQRRAPGQELDGGVGLALGRRVPGREGRIACALVSKRPHALAPPVAPRACLMAATILG
jgi:hypothetical protein